jgi:REP element-mobilizing transposase RayT
MRQGDVYQTHSALFIHLVWATWDRLPLLTEDIQRQVYRAIGAKCVALHAEMIAIGGVEDHVHLLVRLPATLSVAEFVKHAKGSSAHLVTHRLTPDRSFRWQRGYGASSVSPRDLTEVRNYIAGQREHHGMGTLVVGWELDREDVPMP